jgi:hypothetical protein
MEKKIEEFNKGQLITIEETPSYPKLKLEKGYIDIRDDIINKNNLEFEAREMSKEEVLKQLGCSEQELDEWVKENINK